MYAFKVSSNWPKMATRGKAMGPGWPKMAEDALRGNKMAQDGMDKDEGGKEDGHDNGDDEGGKKMQGGERGDDDDYDKGDQTNHDHSCCRCYPGRLQ